MAENEPQRAGDRVAIVATAWERRDSLALALLLLAFVATRLAWVAWSPQTASYWEEAYRWVAAHEILSGSTRPFLDYQADHYQGGSLVAIGLAIASFRLGGESILTLKLGAVLLSTATLALLFAIGRCYFGRVTALLASLAYLAGPPLVAFFGVTLMGFHAESTLFSLLQIAVFLGLLAGRWRSPAAWVAFGLACGAGISFTYITALSAGACGIAWLRLEGRPRTRELAWTAAGFAVGLGPWLAYNATHGFAGLGRIAEVFGLRASPDTWVSQSLAARLADLLARVPGEGLLDPSRNALPEAVRPVVFALFGVPVAGALVAAAARSVRVLRSDDDGDTLARRELVFGIYAVLFLVAILASRFTFEPEPATISFRLFPPLVVLLMLPVALSAQRMLSVGGTARWTAGIGAVACLAAMATATVAFVVRPPDPGSDLSLRLGYLVYGRLLHRKYPDLAEALASARRVDGGARHESLLRGIGWEVEYRFETAGDTATVLSELREIPAAERAPVLRGLLWGASQRVAVLSARDPSTRADRATLARLVALARAVESQQGELGVDPEDGS